MRSKRRGLQSLSYKVSIARVSWSVPLSSTENSFIDFRGQSRRVMNLVLCCNGQFFKFSTVLV